MKILNLTKHQLYLTYTWGEYNHGISGHLFEIIEYYMLLKNYFDIGIFIPDLNKDILIKAIISKYNFSELEITDLLNKVLFNSGGNPSVVKTNNILFVDGGYTQLNKITILANNVILFACGDKTIQNNNKHNWFILQDNRVYNNIPYNSFNYKKKILFNRLKTISDSDNKILIYATQNCRILTEETKSKLFSSDKEFLVVTDAPEQFKSLVNVIALSPPILNIFEKFNKYYYTSTPRKFDCSPRFIAECKYYNKDVKYINIDYLHMDTGLYWRKWDIENDFQSLFLKEDDKIITILKGIL